MSGVVGASGGIAVTAVGIPTVAVVVGEVVELIAGCGEISGGGIGEEVIASPVVVPVVGVAGFRA